MSTQLQPAFAIPGVRLMERPWRKWSDNILLSGALQLVPYIRRRAPRLHRWNGRIYMVAAFSVSLAGLYMMWFRGSVGDLSQHLGQSLDAVLIMLCAVLALRYALMRDFKTHRRWSLRLFMVVSASLFIRAGFLLSFMIHGGPFGSLGYQLIQAHKLEPAIRIFQLNVEAYPKSANTWDSLAGAYMHDGQKPQAIAYYQKSLQLNPKNKNAVNMLQKLNAP